MRHIHTLSTWNGSRALPKKHTKPDAYVAPRERFYIDAAKARAMPGVRKWLTAISRTLVEGTWLKMLRYQCTMQRCQAASGKEEYDGLTSALT